LAPKERPDGKSEMSATAEAYDVIIAGAGPAGTSAAIHLASRDIRVLLIEQKKFPRAKLCGEFISPECASHFQRLGVAGEMTSSEPALLTETVFYSRSGRRVVVPSGWFGNSAAFGLSRAVMDDNLMNRAKAVGVSVLENASVSEVIESERVVRGVRVKTDSGELEFRAPITIDATGRARALARKVTHAEVRRGAKPKWVAFKAHLEKARAARGVCEIYVYSGGYGGLSSIEGNLSNLCFIIAASEVRRCNSNPDIIMKENVMTNHRAAHALESATVCSEWLSVSLETFGRQSPSPAKGLLAVGDSAAFIDPFTGSGMLMALESGELASQLIVHHLNKLRNENSFATLAADYTRAYKHKFDSRLRVCSLLRHAAFAPRLAAATIVVFGTSDRLRSWIARSTRSRFKKDPVSARFG
jgi:flavin-dependent dehydrogenase